MTSKKDRDVGVVVTNTGPGVGFRSEASGVGTTGTKIVGGGKQGQSWWSKLLKKLFG